jgi:hypothetical protein
VAPGSGHRLVELWVSNYLGEHWKDVIIEPH